MPEQDRKLSDILKEMAETVMRDPRKVPSSEAAHVALFFANAAWNECVGLDGAREGYRNVWETIEAENPALWNEFTSNDINEMIDELIKYKKAHFPDDQRRILTCGIPDNKVRVEWLPPVAPGVDTKWEMRLYGLVRTSKREEAVKFLQETRRLSRSEAEKQVKKIASDLGMR
jgi:phosphomannomutase